jgi:SAM-dependent methyltransferase
MAQVDDLDAVRSEFDQTVEWNSKFWHRMRGMGYDPGLEGATCLDFGSGLGALSHDIARRGAQRVVGLDISDERIRLSRGLLDEHAPEISDRIRFVIGSPLDHCAENSIDAVFSRDTFEHVLDLPAALQALRSVLKPGGRIYTGFGPLYNSPFGDHGLIAGRPRASGGAAGVPWGHLAFGDLKSNWLARLRPRAMEQARDLLNTLPYSAYEDTFRDCGMQVEAFHVNVSDNPGMKALSILRRLPPLREYCSVNIYSVLRKPPRETA